MTPPDQLSKHTARLREQSQKWGEVRFALDAALLALDQLLFLDQELPRILMAIQAARHFAAECAFNDAKIATQLEDSRKTLEWSAIKAT